MSNKLSELRTPIMVADKKTPLPKGFLWHPVHFCSLGFGSGVPYFMPGTWGSLCALLLFVLVTLLWGTIAIEVHLGLVLLSTLMGIYFCGYTANALGVADHSAIVWDEFAGMWMALLWLPQQVSWYLAAFVLFRVFDVLKPWPISWADKRLKGGLGIMLDDLIAAGYTLFILHTARYLIGDLS